MLLTSTTYPSIFIVLLISSISPILGTLYRPIPENTFSSVSDAGNATIASFSKHITLTGPHFAVDIDFVNKYEHMFLNVTYDLSGYMAIALYTNETLMGGACDSFKPYICGDFECFAEYNNKRNASFPYFNVTGYTIQASLFMDYTYFFNYGMKAVYALECSGNYSLGESDISGVIGMGKDGSGVRNYVFKPPMFSVFLHDNSSTIDMIFDCDRTRAIEDDDGVFLSANSNWEVTIDKMNLISPSVSQDIHFSIGTIKVIFDINTEFIGLPSDIYNQILGRLIEANLQCRTNNDSLNLLCTYDLPIAQLPILHVNDVKIPPQVYLSQVAGGYNLLFICLTDTKAPFPYKVVSPSYKRYIILGRSFLQYYYVCFGAQNDESQIQVYIKSNTRQATFRSWLPYITLAIILIIPVACFCSFWVRSCFTKKESKRPRVQFLRGRMNQHILAHDSPMLRSATRFRRMGTSPL